MLVLPGVMKYYAVPRALRREVLAFQHHILHNKIGSDETVLKTLPRCMQKRIGLYVRIKYVSAVPIFQNLPSGIVAELAGHLENVVAEPGQIIVEAGDEEETSEASMFFLVHGFADVINAEGSWVATLRRGSFFGELALLLGSPRTATVQALTYCDLFALRRDGLNRTLELFPEMDEMLRDVFLQRVGGLRAARRRRSSEGIVRRLSAVPDNLKGMVNTFFDRDSADANGDDDPFQEAAARRTETMPRSMSLRPSRRDSDGALANTVSGAVLPAVDDAEPPLSPLRRWKSQKEFRDRAKVPSASVLDSPNHKNHLKGESHPGPLGLSFDRQAVTFASDLLNASAATVATGSLVSLEQSHGPEVANLLRRESKMLTSSNILRDQEGASGIFARVASMRLGNTPRAKDFEQGGEALFGSPVPERRKPSAESTLSVATHSSVNSFEDVREPISLKPVLSQPSQHHHHRDQSQRHSSSSSLSCDEHHSPLAHESTSSGVIYPARPCATSKVPGRPTASSNSFAGGLPPASSQPVLGTPVPVFADLPPSYPVPPPGNAR
eukprot:NODE_550_length_1976_cov_8.608199_g441_i0.p1 GENE.NODE_550_length_1976_cov_8.608199_g441_i0~~NODE_550_length_1976_cov_8.608199_g441_i0.p1  ORF type:complete len:554 (+),score=63.14 NODE_550_length_1976_cov_8.608199_g441_i0:225-1886(+)